jgi:hypothetical protein
MDFMEEDAQDNSALHEFDTFELPPAASAAPWPPAVNTASWASAPPSLDRSVNQLIAEGFQVLSSVTFDGEGEIVTSSKAPAQSGPSTRSGRPPRPRANSGQQWGTGGSPPSFTAFMAGAQQRPKVHLTVSPQLQPEQQRHYQQQQQQQRPGTLRQSSSQPQLLSAQQHLTAGHEQEMHNFLFSNQPGSSSDEDAAAASMRRCGSAPSSFQYMWPGQFDGSEQQQQQQRNGSSSSSSSMLPVKRSRSDSYHDMGASSVDSLPTMPPPALTMATSLPLPQSALAGGHRPRISLRVAAGSPPPLPLPLPLPLPPPASMFKRPTFQLSVSGGSSSSAGRGSGGFSVPSGMSGIGAALAASAAAAAAGGGSPAYSYSSNASSSTPAVLRSSGGSSAAAEQVLSSSPLLTRIAAFQDGLPQTQFTCGATAAAAGHLSLLTAALSAAPATSSDASNGEHNSNTAAAAAADAPPLRIGPDALLLAALSGAPVHLLDQLYARRAVADGGTSTISNSLSEPDSAAAAAAAAAAVHADANSERDAMQTSSEEAVSSDVAATNSNSSSSSSSSAEWDAALRAVLSAAAGSGCSDTWQWACRMLQTVSAGGIAGAEQDAAAALRTCADTAARCGHLPVLQLIAKSGLNVVLEPAVLDAATAGGKSDVVTWLLSQVSAYSCNIILIVFNIVLV